MPDETLSEEVKVRITLGMKEGIRALGREHFPHQSRAESMVLRQAIYEYLQRHPIKSRSRGRDYPEQSGQDFPRR